MSRIFGRVFPSVRFWSSSRSFTAKKTPSFLSLLKVQSVPNRRSILGVCGSVPGREFGTMAPIAQSSLVVDKFISDNKVAIFSKSSCPFCLKVKELFKNLNVPYTVLELDQQENGSEIQSILLEKTGQSTVPNVFVAGQHIGGADKTLAAHSRGELLPLIGLKKHDFEYDLVVIGGGSGGLAAAKEAANLGAKVAVYDFVKPTPLGTTWGLGGTCVNVGCIPKKLMHQAALLGHSLEDSHQYGWNTSEEKVSHDWGRMVEAIQNHIGSLNWGYRVTLRDKKVNYMNAYATFIDSHTLKTVDKKGTEKLVTADNVIICIGGRPRYPPEVLGVLEYCLTSDDLFSLPYAPGKTLCVGASYISLECAGFMAGLGYDVTIMVRSILLRGFDQQMAEKIGFYMEEHGVKFIKETIPTKIEKIEDGTPGKLRVTATNSAGETIVDEYNTVLFAVGRDACTRGMGLEEIGVTMAKNGKIVVNEEERSVSVSNIYAVGDVREGGQELTPVAIQAGKLLARRLYGNGHTLTDYINVPTTVFTPLEYGAVGLSEEDAILKYGDDDIEVYHSHFQPLEFTVAHRSEKDCYAKLVCVKSLKEQVVGFHYLGPNAGEVTQGFSIALKFKATKADFSNLIGIHPTCAEIFTTMSITKRSGKDVSSQGC